MRPFTYFVLLVCATLFLTSCHKSDNSTYGSVSTPHNWTGTVFYWEISGSVSHGHNNWTVDTNFASEVQISADHSTATFLNYILFFQGESDSTIDYAGTGSLQYLKYFKSSGNMAFRYLDESQVSYERDINVTTVK